MATGRQITRIVLQIVLGVVIVILAYYLYLSITEPYKAVKREQELTRLTRDRMSDIRTALIRYELLYDHYPPTLDSLVAWIRQDSFMMAKADSIFGPGFILDSLIYSPRDGKFEYAVNDTGRVEIYYLKDPASDDHIGSLEPDVTKLNAASWE
ncbi:hypothetical protein [Rhodothermus marinus]|uniref:Type II secretion system protein GspG C-terminal domain-containing protein n=1 Tax=Rhodothermus marinus (strain ATCC 43812 / DSM 4252 / R-10) TaxID=518766 RepID=D0MDG6_RHOM4|nr:hypothetical protein [Rhodothermus marinus]ACY47159.1 hypothetical protein Rmar_0253 [Rhodothermus marinus DSM 4252]